MQNIFPCNWIMAYFYLSGALHFFQEVWILQAIINLITCDGLFWLLTQHNVEWDCLVSYASWELSWLHWLICDKPKSSLGLGPRLWDTIGSELSGKYSFSLALDRWHDQLLQVSASSFLKWWTGSWNAELQVNPFSSKFVSARYFLSLWQKWNQNTIFSFISWKDWKVYSEAYISFKAVIAELP